MTLRNVYAVHRGGERERGREREGERERGRERGGGCTLMSFHTNSMVLSMTSPTLIMTSTRCTHDILHCTHDLLPVY